LAIQWYKIIVEDVGVRAY